MSLDINNSPYLQPLPRSNTHDALGFGRHGVRKSKDKESWLKKIWSQVFANKRSNATTAEHTRERAKQRLEKQKERDKEREKEKDKREEDEKDREKERERARSREAQAREIRKETRQKDDSNTKDRDTSEETPSSTSPIVPRRPQSNPTENTSRQTSAASIKLPPINHTNDSSKPKVTFAPAPGTTARPRAHSGKLRSERDSETGSFHRPWLRKEAKSLSNIPVELANSPYLSSLKDRTFKDLMVEKKKEFIRSKEQLNRPRPTFDGTPYRNPLPLRHSTDFSHTTTLVDSWRKPRLPRGSSFTELEDRAKRMATKASKNNKIFTCDMPYPMDVYIRCSLRKRDWVEKFNVKIQNSPTRGGTSCKLEVEDDEDFEAICDQDVPAPWEEDYGIYAMMSRLVRHYPARFIWGGRGVNTLVLKNEVLVNHFTKAHYFSSKTGLTTNIRDLSWYVPGDPYEYFPRSYILGEDEKEDFIYDFQLTVCMSILKWALAQNAEKDETTEEHHNGPDNKERESQVQNEETANISIDTEKVSDNVENKQKNTENPHNESVHKSLHEESTPNFQDKSNDDDYIQDGFQDGGHGNRTDLKLKADDIEGTKIKQFDLETDCHENDVTEADEDVNDDVGESGDVNDAEKAVDTNNNSNSVDHQTKGDAAPSPRRKVLPEITEPAKKKGGTVPVKSIDWAMMQCERFLTFKEHGDLDQINTKRLNLQAAQWDSMYKWLEKIVKDGAKIVNCNNKQEEVQNVLDRMAKVWPQFDIDGMRNLWIVKPGAKSKGVGIEFHSNLQEMLKYTENGVLTGTYVVQKYIEQPLLIYNCKFDIRQWFLVTDWNPLTVWFYKDCYLRICSQEYNIDAMHEAVHLSNVSIQQFYLNGKRNEKLPDNNFMTKKAFEEYLSDLGAPNAWEDTICPGMKESIIHALMCTLDVTENRKNAFELYGADFMISEDFRPWMLEINSSPGMAPQSKEKAKLCAAVVEDTIKVVLDLRENKNCDTGDFELIFKDQPLPAFKCIDNKLYLRGSKITKSNLVKYSEIDTKIKKEEKEKENIEQEKQRKKEEDERRKEDERRIEEERKREQEEAERAAKAKEEEEDSDENESDDEMGDRNS